jgi:hypothetical protein
VQPTDQYVVPLNFWQGTFSPGTYTLSFGGGLDFIITSITATQIVEGGQAFLDIGDTTGNFFFRANLNPSGADWWAPVVLRPLIVLPDITELQMETAVSDLALSIDGYRLGPSQPTA